MGKDCSVMTTRSAMPVAAAPNPLRPIRVHPKPPRQRRPWLAVLLVFLIAAHIGLSLFLGYRWIFT